MQHACRSAMEVIIAARRALMSPSRSASRSCSACHSLTIWSAVIHDEIAFLWPLSLQKCQDQHIGFGLPAGIWPSHPEPLQGS